MRNFVVLGAFLTAASLAGEVRAKNRDNCITFFTSNSVADTLLAFGYDWTNRPGNPDGANAAGSSIFVGLMEFLDQEDKKNCSQYLVEVAHNVSPE